MNNNKFTCKIELNLSLDQAKIMEKYLGSGVGLEDRLIELIKRQEKFLQDYHRICAEGAVKAGPQYYNSDFVIESLPKQVMWRNKEGKSHRVDGPAVDYVYNDDGNVIRKWFLDGQEVSEEEHARLVALKAFW